MFRLEWKHDDLPVWAHAETDDELKALLQVGCERGRVVSVVRIGAPT